MEIADRAGRRFWRENWLLVLVLALLFLERAAALWTLGAEYTLASDDLSYVKSGIYFAQNGVITMHGTTPSAQIMPGMTWLIGLFAALFGEGGHALWLALKLLWISMGTATGWFLFKSVTLFAPKCCGAVACLPLFGADFVWTDNLILTETPFILCLSAMLYYTFLLGRERSRRAFAGCAVSYLAAILLKANIAVYPLFALGYLLAVKYPFKRLLKQGLILACLVLCFLVPWTVRNYVQFHAFVPLTYGAGNPTLLGTYQGYGYPADEELDYASNVDEPFRETYAAYFDENGEIPERYQKYLSLQHDGMKASYRLEEWAQPGSEKPDRLLRLPEAPRNCKGHLLLGAGVQHPRNLGAGGTGSEPAALRTGRRSLPALPEAPGPVPVPHHPLWGERLYLRHDLCLRAVQHRPDAMRCILVGLGASALVGGIRRLLNRRALPAG